MHSLGGHIPVEMFFCMTAHDLIQDRHDRDRDRHDRDRHDRHDDRDRYRDDDFRRNDDRYHRDKRDWDDAWTNSWTFYDLRPLRPLISH